MPDTLWIPIGRGTEKTELEDMVQRLKRIWSERYDYRIECDDEDADENVERYRLLVKHL